MEAITDGMAQFMGAMKMSLRKDILVALCRNGNYTPRSVVQATFTIAEDFEDRMDKLVAEDIANMEASDDMGDG